MKKIYVRSIIKKLFVAVVALWLICNCVYAQSPTYTDYSPLVFLKRNTPDGGFVSGIQTQLSDGTNLWYFGTVQGDRWSVSKGDYQGEKLTVTNAGNVGIGTISPGYKLDIKSADYLSLRLAADHPLLKLSSALYNSGDGGEIWQNTNGQLYININSGLNALFVSGTGNIGVGTTTTDAYKLSINGNVRAKEIKVETGWSDYVFYPTYKLLPLAEVAKYIKTNQHLPDVPSAAEVEKNGINVGETNALLLKKIEELTLYLIEKDKQIDDLKQQKLVNQTQQTQIDELRRQVETLLKKKP